MKNGGTSPRTELLCIKAGRNVEESEEPPSPSLAIHARKVVLRAYMFTGMHHQRTVNL